MNISPSDSQNFQPNPAEPIFDPDLIPPPTQPSPSQPPSPSVPPEQPPSPSPEELPKRLPSWRFWLAMLLQLGLILPVPLRNAYVAVVGETIVLDTIAVDPYDIFRGYSQTLAYSISDPDAFEALPGYEIVKALEDRPQETATQPPTLYILLEAPASLPDLLAEQSPTTWNPVGIARERPQTLPPQQVVLRATHNGNAILYNLERYYMPEDQRDQINQTVQELQQSEVGEVKVEVKVDRFGKAIPVGLWLGDRRYQF